MQVRTPTMHTATSIRQDLAAVYDDTQKVGTRRTASTSDTGTDGLRTTRQH
jgi:hypothetical protein